MSDRSETFLNVKSPDIRFMYIFDNIEGFEQPLMFKMLFVLYHHLVVGMYTFVKKLSHVNQNCRINKWHWC